MQKRLLLQFKFKDHTSMEVYGVAKRIDLGEWQAGLEINGQVTWYNVYGNSSGDAINQIEKLVTVDVENQDLVIVIAADEAR
jgi:hypothetical protein